MIRAHKAARKSHETVDLTANDTAVPDGMVWLDLMHPTKQEEAAAESWLGLDLPTREEMQEIETSSRLYEHNEAIFMTATMVTKAETVNPETTAVTFVLTDRYLITIRYADSTAFRAFEQSLRRQPALLASRQAALAAVLDATIDRLADVLESVQANLDGASRRIFDKPSDMRGRDLHDMLTLIGRNGDLVAKVRESLVSFGRLDGYARRLDAIRQDPGAASRMKTVSEDIQSLTDHASFMNSKVDFLLNATLGRINIEQNATIKIFSVVAVIFMPPTLIASIYGMNFQNMPELHWAFGYPLALLAMVGAAIVPYLIFKKRGWL